MSAANILLDANQPQGMGMAANASQMLGLGAPGTVLQDQLKDEVAAQRKKLGLTPGAFGASSVLFAK